jgi:hypothetical protein
MVDQDMIFHAYRINLLGSNDPFNIRGILLLNFFSFWSHCCLIGGQWRLPLKRPHCLKPTLKAKEYREFVKELNQLRSWPIFSFEMFLFVLVLVITPPLAPSLLVS